MHIKKISSDLYFFFTHSYRKLFFSTWFSQILLEKENSLTASHMKLNKLKHRAHERVDLMMAPDGESENMRGTWVHQRGTCVCGDETNTSGCCSLGSFFQFGSAPCDSACTQRTVTHTHSWLNAAGVFSPVSSTCITHTHTHTHTHRNMKVCGLQDFLLQIYSRFIWGIRRFVIVALVSLFKLQSSYTTDDSLTQGEPSSYTCVDEHASRCALIGPYFWFLNLKTWCVLSFRLWSFKSARTRLQSFSKTSQSSWKFKVVQV